jgi:hypothetical protein
MFGVAGAMSVTWPRELAVTAILFDSLPGMVVVAASGWLVLCIVLIRAIAVAERA